jgi:hypothetical protein
VQIGAVAGAGGQRDIDVEARAVAFADVLDVAGVDGEQPLLVQRDGQRGRVEGLGYDRARG